MTRVSDIESLGVSHSYQNLSRYKPKQPYLKRKLKELKRTKKRNYTRGWSLDAPHTKSERDTLLEECGERCFLLPEYKKFPICKKCREGKCKCLIDCRGVETAKRRARQFNYDTVAKMANEIEEDVCDYGGRCTRQATKKYNKRPSPPYPGNLCCGQRRKGNDGKWYKSKGNKKGICSWKKIY